MTFLRASIVVREFIRDSRWGLYGGKQIMKGNNVSHSERKTRRSWLPNVQHKNLYSQILEQSFRLPVTTYTLRCIDKAGGLDNYLLNTKVDKIAESFRAMEIRQMLLDRLPPKNGKSGLAGSPSS